MRGLKLYPSYQYFYPNDNHVYPIYAAAADLGIPVMFHTGSSIFEGTRTKYAHPMALQDVLVDFPDLDIIMAHGGRPAWYEEAFTLLHRHENLYLDVSGIPPQNLVSKYFPHIDRISERVLFGTDFPTIPSIAENLRTINDQDVPAGFVEDITVHNPGQLFNL
jgi:predicted TIM-barrel fold metal-dependent hydrolase